MPGNTPYSVLWNPPLPQKVKENLRERDDGKEEHPDEAGSYDDVILFWMLWIHINQSNNSGYSDTSSSHLTVEIDNNQEEENLEVTVEGSSEDYVEYDHIDSGIYGHQADFYF